ncbi:ribonuclease H-like domain-containing protein [Dichomitus squalens]|uniref:Ribonuclease H-like domain-containing protein n=1 Tax=Dichomitus squalens TaxID=114155 RepID=A0A4Q9PD96_9APHY|nr:ribonuclease H-like domain-containing protein [Dichomitus squalens]
MPTRQVVAGRILDDEAKRVVEGMQLHLRQRYGTGQSDGWKNPVKASIIGSMVNAEYEAYTLHIHDVSVLPKTAETLLTIVETEIEFCEKVLGMIISAWCTDGGGDCAKMRRLLLKKRPHLAVPHCWAHQVRLVLGDYLKSKTPSVAVLQLMLEAIKWFNTHSRALGLLKEHQRAQYNGRVLALLRPCDTRWTAHVLCAGRFLEIEKAIRICVLTSKDKLVACAGKEQALKDKAEALLSEIEQPAFWTKLAEARTHLEPLAIATNATQGDHARLDVVLITLGNLYHTLEARWKKTGDERELYILAVVLNPMLRMTPFRENNPLLTRQNLWLMFKRNYEHMEQRPTDKELKAAFMEYLNGVGEWSDDSMGLTEQLEFSKHDGKPINLIELWRALNTKDLSGRNGLIKFALWLFSIVPNSAMVERLFSRFGTVHTKLRNRLHSEKVRKVVLVKADIDRIYGTGRHEQRRCFGVHDDSDSDSEPARPNTAENSTLDAPMAPMEAHMDAPRSFISLATELVEAADDDAREPPDRDAEETTHTLAPHSASSLPPSSAMTIPRAEGLYLRNLFRYPTSTLLTAPDVTSNPLAAFWGQSMRNLEAELATYDGDAAEESEPSKVGEGEQLEGSE